MKNFLKTFLLLSFFAPAAYVYPQDTGSRDVALTSPNDYMRVVIRSVPAVTVEFNGHYDYGIFELSANNNGDFSSTEFINGENFGVRHGFGSNAVVKLNLQEKGYLRLCFSGSYNTFSSKYSKILVSQIEMGHVSYDVISFGVGVENNFTPSYRFKPLVGLSLIGSIIGGNAAVYDPDYVAVRNLDIIPAFRLGLSVYSGFEYLVNNKLGINCGLKVVHANLWLKNSKVSNDPNKIYLNDKRIVPHIPFAGWRQFAWGELYAGISYYFGIVQKEYLIKKAFY
jgi:hypothetical protein